MCPGNCSFGLELAAKSENKNTFLMLSVDATLMLTTARLPQILLVAGGQLHLQPLGGTFQGGERLATRITKFAGHILVRLADGLVHIAVRNGSGCGGQRGAAGAVHQGAAVLGTTEQADAHGESFYLRISPICRERNCKVIVEYTFKKKFK